VGSMMSNHRTPRFKRPYPSAGSDGAAFFLEEAKVVGLLMALGISWHICKKTNYNITIFVTINENITGCKIIFQLHWLKRIINAVRYIILTVRTAGGTRIAKRCQINII
jgi:hypothetical protein